MNSNPGAEDQVLEHTPGPYHFMPPTQRDNKWPDYDELRGAEETVMIGLWHNDSTGGIGFEQPLDDVTLVERYNEVPHRCNVPDCPGPKNLARLNAAAALAEAVRVLLDRQYKDPYEVESNDAFDEGTAALAAYRALEQPETAEASHNGQ